jgi:yecA family protein
MEVQVRTPLSGVDETGGAIPTLPSVADAQRFPSRLLGSALLLRLRYTARMQPTLIRDLLAQPNLPPGTFTYHQMQGFFFAIAAAPSSTPPAEWIPLIFGGTTPIFGSDARAEEILCGVLELYELVKSDVLEHSGRLPADCPLHTDAMANLNASAPLSQWARGFVLAHNWLERSWDDVPKGESEGELASMMLTLSFFSSHRIAEAFLAECSQPGMTLPEMAAIILDALPDAAAGYVALGCAIREDLA